MQNMQYSNIDHNSSVSISAYPLEIRLYVQQEKKIAWILILLLLQFMSLDGHQAQLKQSRFWKTPWQAVQGFMMI